MLIGMIVSEGIYAFITLVLMICVLLALFIYIYEDLCSNDDDEVIEVDDDNWDDVVDYLDMVTPDEEEDEDT